MQTEISKVFLQDCLPAMREFADNTFDLAIVDPPYGINAPNMKMGTVGKRKGGYPGTSTADKIKGRLNTGGGVFKNRLLNRSAIDWDNEIPDKEYFDQLFRISKNQIIWGGNYFDLPPTRCIICWDKMQPWENFSQWEMAWTSFDKPAKMYRVSNTGGANKDTKIHPTQKPVALYDKVYRDFGFEGIKVIDTHLGSGSNRISASKIYAHFTGFEKNPMYFFDEQSRFFNFNNQLRLKY